MLSVTRTVRIDYDNFRENAVQKRWCVPVDAVGGAGTPGRVIQCAKTVLSLPVEGPILAARRRSKGKKSSAERASARPGTPVAMAGYVWSDAGSISIPTTRATRSKSMSRASNVAPRRQATAAIMQSIIPLGVMP